MLKVIVRKVLCPSYLVYMIGTRKCVLGQLQQTVFRYTSAVFDFKKDPSTT